MFSLTADHARQPRPERAYELEAQERHDDGHDEADHCHCDRHRVDREFAGLRIGFEERGMRRIAQTDESEPEREQHLKQAAVFDFVIHCRKMLDLLLNIIQTPPARARMFPPTRQESEKSVERYGLVLCFKHIADEHHETAKQVDKIRKGKAHENEYFRLKLCAGNGHATARLHLDASAISQAANATGVADRWCDEQKPMSLHPDVFIRNGISDTFAGLMPTM